MRLLRKVLYPLIWLKDLQGNIITHLTKRLATRTGADRPNKFKTWKLQQSFWIQLLIELPIYILILWILNLMFNALGYEISPW